MAGKLAWRVREGAAREKGRKWHLARQPTSTQKTGGHAQAYGVRCRGIRVIWLRLDCIKPNLQKVQGSTRRKDA